MERIALATPSEVRSKGEEQFIERLRAGETAAFDTIVDERSGEIYALLLRLMEDAEEARDLTQETFLQAFRNIKAFRGESSLKTWIYRIAINQARNRRRWWRRRRQDRTVSLDASESGDHLTLSESLTDERDPNPEQLTLRREREATLLKALSKLKLPFREVIVLRDVEGLSYEEVAAALNISVGTVKSRLSRARTEMRRSLEGCF
ncbi:MAG: sigma-70 family RNA polymerase sigma factor [Pyrinomonadaceae bacterium]|nr:sigma-70 family RNA polymerase sigma factor [Pyrinomonadaceae bacterium]